MKMTQEIIYWIEDEECSISLPSPSQEILNGINWGCYTELFTPAFWVSQFLMETHFNKDDTQHICNGDLKEEIVFCLLGGFGITAELATAAFEQCKRLGLIEKLETDHFVWQSVLDTPVIINGRRKHYRYPKQKSVYLSEAMKHLRNNNIDFLAGKELRDELLKIKGIGAKTAGWITRNYSNSDDVAIIDIHIFRAGVICGIFEKSQRVERDYFDMENRFLIFCNNVGVKPSKFDCFLWDQMRLFGKIGVDCYKDVVSRSW
ncbi:TPA: 8-oxoguanine DNA glycosylase [Vibrio cholerae]|nr:8-oxoguanine DNA glycosylase [Vibrio cholerae]